MRCNDCIHYKCCCCFMTSVKERNKMNYGNSETWSCFEDASLYIKLPCKVGDTVYQIGSGNHSGKSQYKIYESVVKTIIYDTSDVGFDETVIGNSIFLTREAAEQALKEREADAAQSSEVGNDE